MHVQLYVPQLLLQLQTQVHKPLVEPFCLKSVVSQVRSTQWLQAAFTRQDFVGSHQDLKLDSFTQLKLGCLAYIALPYSHSHSMTTGSYPQTRL